MTKTADTTKLTNALATAAPEIQPGMTLQALLKTKTIRSRFEDVLSKKAAGFMSSILSVYSMNPALQEVDPMSIISSAAIAASLDLPINPSLGFAHLVPYSGMAQFQLGWKGFVQLAMRSGQYRTLNVVEVYEGQLILNDPFTGLMEFDAAAKKSEKIVGYVAYERLLNGFEKYLYMSVEQVTAHGKKFSKTFAKGKGKWVTDFQAMALKTVIKMLLSKWGVLSIEMQRALAFDQAVVDSDERASYPDGKDAIEGETVPDRPVPCKNCGSFPMDHGDPDWHCKTYTADGEFKPTSEPKKTTTPAPAAPANDL